MLILNDLYCPMCGKKATKKGRNGLVLCSLCGWITPIRAISLNAVKQHKTGRAAKCTQ